MCVLGYLIYGNIAKYIGRRCCGANGNSMLSGWSLKVCHTIDLDDIESGHNLRRKHR